MFLAVLEWLVLAGWLSVSVHVLLAVIVASIWVQKF